jgi:hypothetical protein
MKPIPDARASLKLARQKAARLRDAIGNGETGHALFELNQLMLNIDDADARLGDAEVAA